ncbi:MAG: hypothetical protein CMJ80_11740 [Planctomycetaceae bacterium]|nr:hypothetical protein [Planctomycetaceae bacterium]
MFRQPAGKIFLLAVWVAASSQSAEAQFFGLGSKQQNQPHQGQEVISNASCGLKSCPPRKETFGYYRENWRRWPVSDSSITDLQLSPFVNTPPDSVPSPIIPEARDEEREMPRRRRPGGGGTSTVVPRPPANIVPSTPDPSPELVPSDRDLPSTTPEVEIPSSSLPNTQLPNDFPGSDLPGLPNGTDDGGFPDEDFTLPGDDSSPPGDDFILPDDNSPAPGEDFILPGDDPSPPGDDFSLPGDRGIDSDASDSSEGFFPEAEIEPTPDTEPNSLPGIETDSEDSPPNDLFDLDDFSQRQPASRRSRELRRHRISQRQLSYRGTQPRTLSHPSIQPASRRAPGQRSNPLRVKRAVVQRATPARHHNFTPQHRTVSYHEEAAPVQYAPEYEPTRAPNWQPTVSRRSVEKTRHNPLR